MRTLSMGLAMLLAFSATAYAQSLEERLEAKLKKPFLKNAAWVHDFAEAKGKAKEQGKVIFAYFTRSYAP
ncbi:MAG: hypothetical protein ACYTG3_07320 [Planctomycetota bacterium]|jgi:hypothetical protein